MCDLLTELESLKRRVAELEYLHRDTRAAVVRREEERERARAEFVELYGVPPEHFGTKHPERCAHDKLQVVPLQEVPHVWPDD